MDGTSKYFKVSHNLNAVFGIYYINKVKPKIFGAFLKFLFWKMDNATFVGTRIGHTKVFLKVNNLCVKGF